MPAAKLAAAGGEAPPPRLHAAWSMLHEVVTSASAALDDVTRLHQVDPGLDPAVTAATHKRLRGRAAAQLRDAQARLHHVAQQFGGMQPGDDFPFSYASAAGATRRAAMARLDDLTDGAAPWTVEAGAAAAARRAAQAALDAAAVAAASAEERAAAARVAAASEAAERASLEHTNAALERATRAADEVVSDAGVALALAHRRGQAAERRSATHSILIADNLALLSRLRATEAEAEQLRSAVAASADARAAAQAAQARAHGSAALADAQRAAAAAASEEAAASRDEAAAAHNAAEAAQLEAGRLRERCELLQAEVRILSTALADATVDVATGELREEAARGELGAARGELAAARAAATAAAAAVRSRPAPRGSHTLFRAGNDSYEGLVGVSSSDDGAGDGSGSEDDTAQAALASGAQPWESGRHAMPRGRVVQQEPSSPAAPQQVWGMAGVQPELPFLPAAQPPARIGFANRLPPLPR